MKQETVLGLGIGAGIVAWWWSPVLHPAARALTAVLLGPLPALALMQAAAIARLSELPGRVTLYAGTMIGLWGLAIATALAAGFARIDPRLLGVVPLAWPQFLVWLVFGLAGVGAVVAAFKAFGVTETPMLHHLVPQSRREKLLYIGVCFTAGICEELIFRGFLISTLRAASHSTVMAVVLSAGAFGLAHAHQNAAGALRATLLALVLSVPLLVTGSLYPGIAAHVIVDLAAGFWIARWLFRS